MNLQGYFSAVLTASVLGALCVGFVGKPFEKYIKYLASLICILLILAPLRKIDVSSLFRGEAEQTEVSLPNAKPLQELAGQQAEQEICSQIAASLSGATGIFPTQVRIDIDWTEEEPVIRSVTLCLSEKDSERADEAKTWAESAFGVPITVLTEKGG